MITYPRSNSSPPATSPEIRLIGIGNAGVHLADRLSMEGFGLADIIALNTDAQSLATSITERKVLIGEKATRGLGAGGDPEVGWQAGQESLEEIRTALEGANILFLCAGLGGGTGSGIAPLIAEQAREAGATIFCLVTSPFAFEGRRRSSQAAEALAELHRLSDGVIHFANDRMSELATPRSGIEETFAAADAMLSTCVRSLIEILQGGQPMPVGLGDLLGAVRGGSPAALFGRGESAGENRAHEALERALRSPLLDRGRLLSECHSLIAHVSGPASLSFAEVAAIMREIDRHASEHGQLFFGVTTSADPSAPVAVTLLGNYAADEHAASPVARAIHPAPRPAPIRATEEAPEPAPPVSLPVPMATVAEDPKPLFPDPVPTPRPVAPPRAAHRDAAPKPAEPPKTSSSKAKQEVLQFEPVARGRFEKSEPTIVEGEDLDVPTFLRMRSKAK